MSAPHEFFIDLERGEICALERFLECSGSMLLPNSRETTSTALVSALQAIHKPVQNALQQLDQDAQISEVSIAMQLLEEQADAAASAFKRLTVSELDLMLEDEEASNDVSLAIWKILDVIGPVEVHL